jgi:hypothetical protein
VIETEYQRARREHDEAEAALSEQDRTRRQKESEAWASEQADKVTDALAPILNPADEEEDQADLPPESTLKLRAAGAQLKIAAEMYHTATPAVVADLEAGAITLDDIEGTLGEFSRCLDALLGNQLAIKEVARS